VVDISIPLLSTLNVYYPAGFILIDWPPVPHDGANSRGRREVTWIGPSGCRGQRHHHCTLKCIATMR